MEIILIGVALIWLVQNAAVETKHAARGTTSPRWQAKLERLRQQGQQGYVPRYGSREWFADLWSDGLEASTEHRRVRSTRRKAAELDTAVGEALAVAAPAEPVQEAAQLTPNFIFEFDYEEDQPAAEPTPHGDPRPDAQVIPMFPTPKEEVSDMSEITGLQSAIAYAQQVAGAHAAHSTAGNESYLGSLQSFEVSGEDIHNVAAAQAASSIAAAAWSKAAAGLSRQNVVKEAYDNVPGAGNKRFVQGE